MCGIYTGEKQIGKRLPICSSSVQSREHERACAVSQPADSSPLQLVSMIQVQIRKRFRICCRRVRLRMSTAKSASAGRFGSHKPLRAHVRKRPGIVLDPPD